MGTIIMLVIAGNCIDFEVADEIEDIVKTSIISGRMRELSHLGK
jgi:hypothetical protein